ncbi:MAG: hypothetical protein AAFY72_11340, partial [Cyanobacteria bacterium J06649_4]
MLSDVSSEPISLTPQSTVLGGPVQSQDLGYGVSLSAMGLKPSAPVAPLYKSNVNGFAVKGGGRYYNQIDFDATTNSSEKLIIDFTTSISQASVELGKMTINEWEGLSETGKWTSYDEFGNLLASGIFDPTDNGQSTGKDSFSFDIDSPNS